MSSPLPLPPLNDDDVLAEDQYVEVPERHLKILDERIARYDKFGWEGTPWAEFKKEIDGFLEQEVKKRTQVK